MSTFATDDRSATFLIDSGGYKHAGPWPQDYAIKVKVESQDELDNLFALQSWNVHTDRAVGGETVWTDVGSGAGEGDLVADDLGAWTAVLTEVGADAPLGAGGVRLVSVKFLLTGLL